MAKTVPEALSELAVIHRERAQIYGQNYKEGGQRLAAFFPRGLTLKTSEDFGWFHLFVQLDSKLSRYAQSRMINGEGHADSLSDIAVYALLLQEIDAEAKELKG